jgi:hypothetical protein
VLIKDILGDNFLTHRIYSPYVIDCTKLVLLYTIMLKITLTECERIVNVIVFAKNNGDLTFHNQESLRLLIVVAGSGSKRLRFSALMGIRRARLREKRGIEHRGSTLRGVQRFCSFFLTNCLNLSPP